MPKTISEIMQQFKAQSVDVIFGQKYIMLALTGRLKEALTLVTDSYGTILAELEHPFVVLSCAFVAPFEPHENEKIALFS